MRQVSMRDLRLTLGETTRAVEAASFADVSWWNLPQLRTVWLTAFLL